jgi:hypothetical protein
MIEFVLADSVAFYVDVIKGLMEINKHFLLHIIQAELSNIIGITKLVEISDNYVFCDDQNCFKVINENNFLC